MTSYWGGVLVQDTHVYVLLGWQVEVVMTAKRAALYVVCIKYVVLYAVYIKFGGMPERPNRSSNIS